MSGSTAGAVVEWYVDHHEIGVGSSVSWDTSDVGNGTHLLSVDVEPSSGPAVEIERTASVSNWNVAVADVGANQYAVVVYVSASSPQGPVRVSASLDGNPLDSLPAPNACLANCTAANAYRFEFDAVAAGAGAHEIRFVGVDAAGASRELSVSVPVVDPPSLHVSSPFDGAFVSGALKVTGTASTQAGRAVTVTANMGDVPFVQTTAQPFDANIDLTGVVPGPYALTFTATDWMHRTTTVQYTIMVVSSPAKVRVPAFTIVGQTRAIDGDRVLYTATDQSVRLRNVAAGTEVVLQGAKEIDSLDHFVIAGSRVYADGHGADCNVNTLLYCVYQWQADGSRRNLSIASPLVLGPSQFVGVNETRPVAHGDKVIWINDNTNTFTLYDASSDVFALITVPSDISRVGNFAYDFADDGATVRLFYWAPGAPHTEDIYRWSSASGSSVKLSSSGTENSYPQTDGVNVAWEESSGLMIEPVAGGSPTLVTSSASGFLLRDGVLAWTESTLNGSVLKAWPAATISKAGHFAGDSYVVGGHVLYYETDDELYDWSSATGISSPVFRGRLSLFLSGDAAYFHVGDTSNAAYKLSLVQPSVDATPVADAGVSQLVVAGTNVTLDGSYSSDANGDALSYNWTLTSKPTGSAAALTGANTARPAFVADVAGSYNASLVVSDAKSHSAASPVTVLVRAADALNIVTDPVEPLPDTVTLSLSRPTAADAVVTWYVDLDKDFQTYYSGIGYRWDTVHAGGNGQHLVMARVETPSSPPVEVRRSVQVANSGIQLSVVPDPSYFIQPWPTYVVYVVSTFSPEGIASVSASVDGTPLGTLTSPNRCQYKVCPVANAYGFGIDAAIVGFGAHDLTIVATDQVGHSRQITVSAPLPKQPGP